MRLVLRRFLLHGNDFSTLRIYLYIGDVAGVWCREIKRPDESAVLFLQFRSIDFAARHFRERALFRVCFAHFRFGLQRRVVFSGGEQSSVR